MILLFLQLSFAQMYFENIDEEIRFHEDPYYASYLKEKMQQVEREREAQQSQRKISSKQKASAEAARLSHIKTRDRLRINKETKNRKAYAKFQKQRNEQKKRDEGQRTTYVSQRNQEILTKSITREREFAKMKQEINRLPANYFNSAKQPRVDKKKRKLH